MNIIEIENISDPRLSPFASLTDAQLRNDLNPEQGLIIVESPKVIKVALGRGWLPVALLCERKHIDGDAMEIIDLCPPDLPIYTADRPTLASLTGYTLTRGVLCAMHRRPQKPLDAILRNARRVCVLDGVCDTTNIGAIFRSAAALGIDAVFLTPGTCDPLNRRAIRVSMGSVFLVDWTHIESIDALKAHGFKTLAMALRNDSISLRDPSLKNIEKLAIIMGTEGDGLSPQVIGEADFVVKIPMYHNVDSLNVAAASALAFWELSK